MNNNTCLIRMDNENHFETTKMTSSIHSPFSWWGRRWTRSSSKLEQSESFAGAFFFKFVIYGIWRIANTFETSTIAFGTMIGANLDEQ